MSKLDLLIMIANNATNATDTAKAKNPELVILITVLGCIGILVVGLIWWRSLKW